MILFNSLTGKKELFKPINRNKVLLYVCGITPYDTTHLGHAFIYVSFDMLVRYLRFRGYKVSYTQNVTDINDRDNDILKRAQEQNISWQKLADFWTKKFLKDMTDLNWIIPTNYIKASENIDGMIRLIEENIKNGIAYVKKGSVYLDISKVKEYGKLSKFDRDTMLETAREFDEDIANPQKRDPLDITLWRAASADQPAHIPSFDSPWGKGRPGWHIECSAMAITTLGEQIDIHGGGIDIIYPHHEAEIAQVEGATGKVPFVSYWMHTGIISYKGEKMSKSKGNLVMVSDLFKKYSANAVRFLLLSHHYRENWEYEEEDLIDAERKIDLIEKALRIPAASEKNYDNDSVKRFIEYMDNDLNTKDALALLCSLAKKHQITTLKTLYNVLGFK